jgi:DNA polymerase III delta prime subunit
MTAARPAAYRDALQVSPERIASMSDGELNELMRALLGAQAYRCGADVAQVVVNTESRAKDDGADGWSPQPATEDPWLGATPTCWQFKAGVAGEPKALRREVTKRIPKETLRSGGRFVVVASGSNSGIKALQARRATLTKEAAAAQLPIDSIEVIGSEQLYMWCNQHPAIAARWAGRPSGLWQLHEWAMQPLHRVSWQSTPLIEQEINARRNDLDFIAGGSLYHLHIQGPPGVGKTRLALELCKDAAWKSAVIYIQQASDLRLVELIDSAVADQGARLVVVADEVQRDQLEPLRNSVERGQGRVRLITIGHAKTPDTTRIPALSVQPLEPKRMSEIVRKWHGSMPPEHVDFVVRFADGYVRLARLAANAVMEKKSIDIHGLLEQDHIRGFLDGMLGDGDRSALYVVAALAHVGWTDTRQAEGEAVARHLGLDWNTVRRQVDGFQRRLEIAPRGGRLRYISPTPLAIHLAVEAWTTLPDLMQSLPDALPTEEAMDAYYERLQMIASHPQARRFAREQLAHFLRLEEYLDARAARRWSVLAAADPAPAARNLVRALEATSVEAWLTLGERARREVVRGLVRLARKSAAFRDAAVALALLAEAENEAWASNATAEFVARHQVFGGGTPVPYLRRLEVLDELVSLGRPSVTRLVVRALAQIRGPFHTRSRSDPFDDDLPELEWRPATGPELLDCTVAALNRLAALASQTGAGLEADFIKAASDVAMLLRKQPVREPVAAVFDAILGAYPMAREPLRRTIADLLSNERRYWKELAPADLEAIETLHRRFMGDSLSARLHQFVGVIAWDEDERTDLSGIAGEFVADQAILASEWPWLTSGEAGEAWRFGEALALADLPGDLESVLPVLKGAGRDLRALCGYVSKRRELRGNTWFEEWMKKQSALGASTLPLLFEVSWRCGATEVTARVLAQTVREHSISEDVAGQLQFGRWHEGLSQRTLHELLAALVGQGQSVTVIAIVEHRLKSQPEEMALWEEFALQLVMRSELIRAWHTRSFSWKEVALRLLPKHAGAIAESILREQANRGSGSWFAKDSDAGAVLDQCAEAAPSDVWRSLAGFLTSPSEASRFTIGFPQSVLDRMPLSDVKAWVSADAKNRAPIIAGLASRNLSNDTTLASHLLAEFGDDENVGEAFFMSFAYGDGWCGPASEHWEQLAASADEVANRTVLPKLRRWAVRTADNLRKMAARDREREDEEYVRRR